MVVLVGELAGTSGGRVALRRFQYACNPLAILVSSVHGQLEPTCLLFAMAAFLVVLRGGPQISGRRAGGAGILLGLAIATQTCPVLFAPALLLALRSWRRRLQLMSGAAVVGVLLFATLPFTVGAPLAQLPFLAQHMLGNHPTIGTWGWSGVWLTVHPTALPLWQDPLWLNTGTYGSKAAILGTLLVVWWWRRAHPLDIATVTTTALIAFTPAFGNQYLLWQAPSATARPVRLSIPLQIGLGVYAAIFYLPMQMLRLHNWQVTNDVMMFVSLGAIAFMIAALPWRRRQRDPREPQQRWADSTSAVPERASDPGVSDSASDAAVAERAPDAVPESVCGSGARWWPSRPSSERSPSSSARPWPSAHGSGGPREPSRHARFPVWPGRASSNAGGRGAPRRG